MKRSPLSVALAFLSVLALVLTVVPAVARASWELDPLHTGIHFKVRHLMVSSVRGDFEKFSGTVNYNEADITKTTADFTVDVKSVSTRIGKRDEHLRSPDFFDAEKHPTMTFKSKKAVADGPGKFKLTGDLTIRGVAKEVTFSVEGPYPVAKDPMGGYHTGASATVTINRKDFGLKWNAALETGGVMVGDEVEITIDVELVKK